MPITRRQLLWGAGGAVAVTGSGVLASAIASAAQTSSSQVRTGMVVDYNQGSVTIRFAGGDVQDFPYARRYEPVLGETVILAANGSAWVVVDGLAGMPPDNPVINGGFEQDGGSTTGWGKADLGGASSFALTNPDPPYEGYNCAVLTASGLSIDTVLYSSPIPVRVGDHWSADCAVRTDISNDGGNANAELLLTWYANDTNVYPTTSATDTSISSQNMPVPQNYWSLLRPGPRPLGTSPGLRFPVPAGAAYMRVGVRCGASDSLFVGDFLIDRVIARHLD